MDNYFDGEKLLRVRFETLRRGVQEQRCSLFRDFKVPLFQTFCRSGRLILTGLSGFRNGLLGAMPAYRRAPGCATPTGFAGHASATTASQLTFHLGHSVGADHDTDEMPRREPAKWIYRSR
jgi:hypothetical protein